LLKKTITYTNPFTNEEVTEEHYFHISKADLVEMQMEEHNTVYEKNGKTFTGMEAKLQRMVDAEDGKALIAEMKDFIRRAYGKKDGERFIKSEKISEDFASSEAFSQLLFDICTDADEASAFITGIIPNNIDQIAAEIQARADARENDVDASNNGSALVEGGPRVLTQAEITEMDPDELKSGIATGRYKLS